MPKPSLKIPGSSGVRKAQRHLTTTSRDVSTEADNDNFRPTISPGSFIKRKLPGSANNNNFTKDTKEAVKVAKAGEVAFGIVTTSLIYYPLRLFGSVLLLLAITAVYTTNETWLGWLDVFGLATAGATAAFAISIGVLAVDSIFTFTIANIYFMIGGVNPYHKSLSLIIAPLCIVASLLPLLSLAPMVLAWVGYVVISQKDKTKGAV